MLDQKYFNYSTGLTMTNENFNNLFGKNLENLTQIKLISFIWILLPQFKTSLRELCS